MPDPLTSADIPELKTSHMFSGLIWNTLVGEMTSTLFVEVRNVQEKKVSFSALNLRNYEWLWKDVTLDEQWWVTLAAVAGDRLLFTVYTDTNNPDKKSLIAYDINTMQMVWWYNGFSLAAADSHYIRGTDARFPARETILDPVTGKAVQNVDPDLKGSQNFSILRPFQYEEGSGYFDSVRNFVQVRCGVEPVSAIEYMETGNLIIVSVFTRQGDLANFLYVFNTGGELLLKEKLGENLKGVGFDTFFILFGHLIFVRNKQELIVYKITI